METGYQSDAFQITKNAQQSQSIATEHINSEHVFYPENSNTYTIINNNLVSCVDIRLRRQGGAGELRAIVLKLPVPEAIEGVLSWTTQSTEGNTFFCRLSGFGIVEIEGEISSEVDEVVLTIPPYIASTPIRFADTPVFTP